MIHPDTMRPKMNRKQRRAQRKCKHKIQTKRVGAWNYFVCTLGCGYEAKTGPHEV